MTRFVLIHGAFVGAWVWGPLTERLEAAGHRVEAFDLPGSGEDHTPVAEVTLDACVERLCEVLRAGEEPAVVVPNSMGGVITTMAAARCPERVASIVYVAAFLPEDGESLLDLTNLPEGADDQVQANVVLEGDPPVATMPDEASPDALYGCCSEEVAGWAIAHQRPQAVAPYATPVSLDDREAFEAIPRSYVLCTRDRAIPPRLQRLMADRGGCDEVIELDTDHSPHLSTTDELAGLVERLAMRSAPRAR
jgi:pimeloyl-ACP methyl ester carboxylesterase